MRWCAVDKKLKERGFTFFISFTEVWEMDLIREVILEEIPWLTESELSKVLIECYKEMSPPRLRSEYLKNLRQKLELPKVENNILNIINK